MKLFFEAGTGFGREPGSAQADLLDDSADMDYARQAAAVAASPARPAQVLAYEGGDYTTEARAHDEPHEQHGRANPRHGEADDNDDDDDDPFAGAFPSSVRVPPETMPDNESIFGMNGPITVEWGSLSNLSERPVRID